jgi:hypothetical protein
MTRATVTVDDDQMKYLRQYSKLSGVPIAAIVREMVAQWIEIVYASRIRVFERAAKADKIRRISS